MSFVVALLGIMVTMGLALTRAALGPTTFDRILALNMFGTKTVLLIAVISFFTGRPDFVDLALVYALINFIGVIAVLKFSRHGHFGGSGEPEDSE
jgi:multicomponent Na+:H+ antiporter subunit F